MAERSAGRPTLEDVAAHAGISRATVSRVVNGASRVSEQTRLTVQRAVEELGYRPNQAARSLVTRRTGTLAVVLSEPGEKLFEDPFFAAVIRAAHHELSTVDAQMALLIARSPAEVERVVRFLGSGHTDGALVFTPRRGDPLPGAVRSLGIPVVFGGRPWRGGRGLDVVSVDNEAGATQATRLLLSQGRKRIVTVCGPSDQAAAVDRLTGWRVAMDLGPDQAAQWSEPAEFNLEGGERAMTELLRRVPDLDGVFAASDLMAVGALRALRAAGRRVPEDVAVVGFDDLPSVAQQSQPSLTTIRQDPGAQVREMVAILRERLRGNEVRPRNRMLPVELIRRESA
ncbi:MULTISPECIES: LacI family DNA-binding transcriptional regulator [unclassified Crossiella]|uniref:LacI family DNA-binding transcriptional regulator n=1 Tax=unclassified Crossiella TaxID=2620835 RepID=UPI0020004003|nr:MULTISPECIES: LacI family DNA-binding transcriptional regulator [unclassified Crossiella]MCK2243086.1 LacI family transcriptional regulator [Crossiella sp. S99.2]MCK2256963.1 LacI family transcriptional regulator [Crossiella sp. S99.1]